ncbi:hypothetical protein AHAS_Ahas18G0177100 [Arachis hypogaea]
MYKITARTSTQSRLAFSHLISHLFDEARIFIDRDTFIAEDAPITKESMENTREPAQVRVQRVVSPSKRKMPEQPQEKGTPPSEYWTQLVASIEQLQDIVEQLKEE